MSDIALSPILSRLIICGRIASSDPLIYKLRKKYYK